MFPKSLQHTAVKNKKNDNKFHKPTIKVIGFILLILATSAINDAIQ